MSNISAGKYIGNGLCHLSAEVKAFNINKPYIDWTYAYSAPWPRTSTHWGFASNWCRFLIKEPPAAELLVMVRHLVENDFWVQPEELDLQGLISWLQNFGDEAVRLIKVFELILTQITNSTSQSDYGACIGEAGYRVLAP
ncbi:hypothetical protein C8R44DRAFT_747102 [Mycena epipterygia]|nr:hypothetical protein C8R44DRAFT_747102 [Mycena epipterygia]